VAQPAIATIAARAAMPEAVERTRVDMGEVITGPFRR
jgi:hypothetical protein